MAVNVQINGKTKFRKESLSIIYTKISIPPSPSKTTNMDGRYLPNVPVWAVMAIEKRPSKLHEPINLRICLTAVRCVIIYDTWICRVTVLS